MAKRQITTLIDDLDGAVIDDGGLSVDFGLDGKSYEIDLSTTNAEALRAALAPFIAVARTVPQVRARRARPLTR